MKYYIVGKAEPIYVKSILGGRQNRSFKEKELFDIISKMDTIVLFSGADSFGSAVDYARSLRIQQPSMIFNPQKIKFAPVIEIDCDDHASLWEIEHQDNVTAKIQYTEYFDTLTNFNVLRNTEADVTYKLLPRWAIDLSTIQIKSVLFPDSGHDQQVFGPQQRKCSIV